MQNFLGSLALLKINKEILTELNHRKQHLSNEKNTI